MALAELRSRLLDLVLRKGYERREQPFQLASGAWSHDYVDAKRALASGRDLELAARCVIALAEERGADFDAIGGLTMGADALAHAVSVLTGARWFSVRKAAKDHGKQKLIEGAELRPEERVVVVEDVITTAGSISQALDAVAGTGARVVLATTVVDRGRNSKDRLAERATPYEPLLTYGDLGIEPVDA